MDEECSGRYGPSDSALRETLRLGLVNKSLVHQVVPAGGVTLEDGLHLSQGARIAVSTYGVHRDPEIYPRPYIYEPFRFSRQREEMLGQQQETEGNTIPTDTNTKAKIPGEKEKEGRAATLLAGKNLSAVTTSENFLPFGHAKHACPGRFFAANEIKLAFAYLSTKYDVKQLATRPKGMWIGEFNVVNMKTTMWIRRRKENR